MRQPKPWYWAYKKGWYVKIAGVQHPLGKNPDGQPTPQKVGGEWKPPEPIRKVFHRLMAGEGLSTPLRDQPLPGLVEEFLVDSAKTTTAKTVTWYRGFLDDFAARFPKLKPMDIAPRHVRSWLAAERKRPWQQNTQRSAITILKRLLNWAVENKLLAENPIESMERPAAVRRERILDDAEQARILAWYPEGDAFRDFLVAMTESGSRPGEVIKVTAEDVDFEMGVWILKGKTTRRTGKDRVVYMTATMLELTRRLCERHPEGPIFRNEDGNPWSLQTINMRFRRKKERRKDALDKDVTAYVYRGTWATDALERGGAGRVGGRADGASGDRDAPQALLKVAREAGAPAADGREGDGEGIARAPRAA